MINTIYLNLCFCKFNKFKDYYEYSIHWEINYLFNVISFYCIIQSAT